MAMLRTIHNSYEPMRAVGTNFDVTSADTPLDGSTSGYTYASSDRPVGAYQLRPDSNKAEIVFEVYDVSDGKTFDFNIWGYTETGPAEYLGEFSATVGTGRINDSTTDLYVDTIKAWDSHITSLVVEDCGNNRISKVAFDNVGYKYLYCEVTAISDAGIKVRPMIRTY